MIKNWNEFINERLKISDELFEILDIMRIKGNKIANLLLKLNRKDYEKIPYNPDNIGINDLNKLSINDGKGEIKIGRFISQILKKIERGKIEVNPIYSHLYDQLEEKDITEFVSLYNAIFLNYKKDLEIFTYSGRYIARVYNSFIKPDFNDSELGSSCMNYVKPEILQIYVDNPNKVEIATLWWKNNEFTDGMLLGRAILWKLDNGDKLMDRIYTVDNRYISYFKNWAYDMGYLSKISQNRYDSELYDYGGKHIEKDALIIKLDNIDTDEYYFPYLDTMKYITSDGVLSDRVIPGSIYKANTTNGVPNKLRLELDNLKDIRIDDSDMSNVKYWLLLDNISDSYYFIDRLSSLTLKATDYEYINLEDYFENGKTYIRDYLYNEYINWLDILDDRNLKRIGDIIKNKYKIEVPDDIVKFIEDNDDVKFIENSIVESLVDSIDMSITIIIHQSCLNRLRNWLSVDPKILTKDNKIWLSISQYALVELLEDYEHLGFKSFKDYIIDCYTNGDLDLYEIENLNIDLKYYVKFTNVKLKDDFNDFLGVRLS